MIHQKVILTLSKKIRLRTWPITYYLFFISDTTESLPKMIPRISLNIFVNFEPFRRWKTLPKMCRVIVTRTVIYLRPLAPPNLAAPAQRPHFVAKDLPPTHHSQYKITIREHCILVPRLQPPSCPFTNSLWLAKWVYKN